MKVKVFTGRWHTDEFLKDAINEEIHKLYPTGWTYIGIDSEKHPSEIVEDVETELKNAVGDVYFQTNNDHVFNKLRVMKHRGDLEEVEFIHFYRNPTTGNLVKNVITVDSDGECSEYPYGFLDEWPHQMGELCHFSDISAKD